VAGQPVDHIGPVVAVRAAYAALILGILGGLGLATIALSGRIIGPSTVEEALGLDPTSPDIDRRRADAVAMLVATCMRRQGLDWEPIPEMAPALPEPQLGPVAWAERWGFGISTMVGTPPPATVADPNLDRMTLAGPVGRQAFQRALQGDGRGRGCRAVATDAVYGLRDRLLRPLAQDLAALQRRTAADPASARLDTAWRACVADVATGLPLVRRTLARDLLQRYADRLAALGEGSSPDLLRLQDDERRVATAVARCEVDDEAGRSRIRVPHEAAFVAANRARLAAIGAAIRAAEAAWPTLPP
jgi:hypothetical protein